jgi:hypothetical protein
MSDYNVDYEVPVTAASVKDEVAGLTTMSAKIRYLAGKGMSRADIARTLNIRYQWVRNVLITPVKG